jgi:hypothetical protein
MVLGSSFIILFAAVIMGNEQFSSDPRPMPPGWPGVAPPVQPSTPEWVRHGAALRQKHSVIGIIAFVISVIVVILYGGLMTIAIFEGVQEGLNRPNPPASRETRTTILGLAVIGAMALNGLGTLLGIIGAVIPNRNKLFAWIGLGINAVLLASCMMVTCFGMASTPRRAPPQPRSRHFEKIAPQVRLEAVESG